MPSDDDSSGVSVSPVDEPAGGWSAQHRADELQLEIDAVAAQVAALNAQMERLEAKRRAWSKGAAGEAQVIAALHAMREAGWRVLADRRWPGTAANIDAVVVGPGGVFVIDVKNWKDPRVSGGSLWCGSVRKDDAVAKVRDQARVVEEVVAPVGYPPSQTVPMIVLAGPIRVEQRLDAVVVLGEGDLAAFLAHHGARLAASQVQAIVAALEQALPPIHHRGALARRTPRAAGHPAADRPALFDSGEVLQALIDAACAEPIESWMTWLHPSQSALVSRTWNGPARIRGAVGTGKTVVALHRAAYLAQRTPERILVTSFVRTLPAVHRALFQQLAPQVADRVEFTTLHSWSLALLRSRGFPTPIDADRARTAFNRAWIRVGRDSPLVGLGVTDAYWHDEVVSVIKGRGITDVAGYLDLRRVGRRLALNPSQRQAAWELFTEYEQVKDEAGVWDWQDLILAAASSAREEPVKGYAGVIVDEVQDLNVVGLRLLHSLVGDAPNGLLLVGDGQQSIYAGGFTLAEAGISITGRAAVLRDNYRNGGQILSAALAVVADSDFDDLADEMEHGDREVDSSRPGGRLTEVLADDQQSLDAAGVSAVADLVGSGVRPGDIAVLCRSGKEVRRWTRLLSEAELPAMPLADYRGEPVQRVKVGTYHRSKGLEFAHVLIPDVDRAIDRSAPDQGNDAQAEQVALQRRQLFVAMSRARDGLWLGRIRD